ncbi:MAG TPA: 2-oxoacid:acceptor oxidoreductase subunit alpha [Candidatus Methylomirabilis sp.]|nr:2-oxoacid:acceptor oxidoreductase subunit alpha [Candidatus Methylomirabilis sp.]
MTVESHATASPSGKQREQRRSVVIRFAGDSGDGMQLTGMQFTTESALAGNDVGTLPDFPAEIRAPAGTLAGVSGFQLNFSSQEVYTPGDNPDVLVAMNPAALKVNLADLRSGGLLLIDRDGFDAGNLKKAGYATNPLEDGSLEKYQLSVVDMTGMTLKALEDLKLSNKVATRCKNFFALGLCSWLYNRPIGPTLNWIQEKFKRTPELVEANARVLKAGYHYGETTEMFAVQYEVEPARIAPGTYRNVTGNTALALGLVAAAKKAGLPLFLGSYPITPASDILHELSQYKNFGVYTFQAEDEIAGVCSALGASFGGSIGVTTSSGPGIALKQEAINLAVMVELPMVICNVQRGGPSTGLPTKTEQADLFQAIFGRNSDSPLPVVAAATPGDCFAMAYEAVRIAIKYMTPVILLTDGYLANGAEPWMIPRFEDLAPISVRFRTEVEGFFPYLRDAETLARPWVKPGTPGLEHRIGGIEKEDVTGNISYGPANHELMTRAREGKVAAVAQEIPPTVVRGEERGDLLIVGWGSTYGCIAAATDELRAQGRKVSQAHLRYLNPLPPDLGDILRRFKQVLVPEMNLGQLRMILRATYLVDVVGLNKIQGQPFKVSEIVGEALRLLEG